MKKRLTIFLLIGLLIFSTSNIRIKTALGFYFDKNFLISDKVFTNYKAMNLSDIENFLIEHRSILANYKENGVPSANIIFDAAQKYKVNPEVIIVTLQKEEGLISLSYYNEYAINFAMGFHKPSDFKSQVYGGTKLLRDGYDFLAEKYGWKVGMPHKTEDNPKYVNNFVTPKNKATASLYLYTPYIGGYYKANGSYIGGNYNFVKIFNRFFGDPTKYIDVILTPKRSTFYIPSGKNFTFELQIENTGNTTLKSGEYYISVKNAKTDKNFEKIPINFNLSPKEKRTVPIILNNIKETTEIECSVEDFSSKEVGNSVITTIIPVQFSVSYKKLSDNLVLKIKSNKNVPCAYLKINWINESTGESISTKNILNCAFLNSSIEKSVKIPTGYEELSFHLSFIGSKENCKDKYDPVTFLKETIIANKRICNLNIVTTPENASIFIDEKFVGKSPINLALKQNTYVITVKNGEKQIKKELNLQYDTKLRFVMNNTNSFPPEIKVEGLPEITNKKTIDVNGEVLCNQKIVSLSENGDLIKISSNGKFHFILDLEDGPNNLSITATDVYGNAETIRTEIILDTVPPQITTNKIPGITSDMFFKLFVNVKDGTKLFINGEECKFLKCTAFLKFKKGENKITITAEDDAGNISKKNIKVIYLPPSPTILKLFIGQAILYINGTRKKIDAAPMIKEDRTMLPIRHIVEALNGEICYYADSRTVKIKINGGEVELTIGKNTAIVNGKNEYIDPKNKNIAPFIKNGRTYLPLRFVMESIGSSVKWIPNQKAVIIIYPKIT